MWESEKKHRNGATNEAKMKQNHSKNRCRKRSEKSEAPATPGTPRAGPGSNQSARGRRHTSVFRFVALSLSSCTPPLHSLFALCLCTLLFCTLPFAPHLFLCLFALCLCTLPLHSAFALHFLHSTFLLVSCRSLFSAPRASAHIGLAPFSGPCSAFFLCR